MANEISPCNESFIEPETLAAIRDGLDSIDRSEGIDLAEADPMLREKHEFRRSS